MAAITSPLWPGDGVRAALFVDVANGAEILNAVRTGQVHAAVLDARLVGDPFRLWMAVGKAASAAASGRLRTHALHGDIVYNLSPKTNIGDAFATYGVRAASDSVLVVRLGGTDEDFAATLVKLRVSGRQVGLEALPDICDGDALARAFRTQPGNTRLMLSTAAVKDL